MAIFPLYYFSCIYWLACSAKSFPLSWSLVCFTVSSLIFFPVGDLKFILPSFILKLKFFPFASVHMCLCVHMCVYVHERAHKCARMCWCMWGHVPVCLSVRASVHTHVPVCACVPCAGVCECVCIWVCPQVGFRLPPWGSWRSSSGHHAWQSAPLSHRTNPSSFIFQTIPPYFKLSSSSAICHCSYGHFLSRPNNWSFPLAARCI